MLPHDKIACFTKWWAPAEIWGYCGAKWQRGRKRGPRVAQFPFANKANLKQSFEKPQKRNAIQARFH